MPPNEENPPLLVGHSARIEEIRRLVHKLGLSPSPVLLLGETGTGKEVVARSIHHQNAAGPFVPIDCSLPATLLESELFGHTRGAFTGAVARKAGLLELAEGGTVFLDEIGEFPLEIQVKLLRVLQEKEIRPVGGVERHRTHFRTIAATNRDLAREVERGTFRRDLFYRLNVVTLRLPPLRERQEDIPELAAHFLARHGGRHRLTPELFEAMMNYDWPGNVRELENCIQRMVAMNSGPMLHTGDLPSALAGATLARECAGQRMAAAAAATAGMAVPRESAGRRPVLRLEDLEKQAIQDALAETRGDRTRAAGLLGIGRTTLYRKIKQYQL